MLPTKLSDQVDAKQSTVIFIILTIATGGFYYFYWWLKCGKVISSITNSNAIKSELLLAAIGVDYWASVILLSEEAFAIIYGFIVLAALLLQIYIAFDMYRHVQQALKLNETPLTVKPVWTFFLQGLYFYYLIRNAEEFANTQQKEPINQPVDITDKLEKLRQLKEKGVLTEEEFQSEKKKLLLS